MSTEMPAAQRAAVVEQVKSALEGTDLLAILGVLTRHYGTPIPGDVWTEVWSSPFFFNPDDLAPSSGILSSAHALASQFAELLAETVTATQTYRSVAEAFFAMKPGGVLVAGFGAEPELLFSDGFENAVPTSNGFELDGRRGMFLRGDAPPYVLHPDSVHAFAGLCPAEYLHNPETLVVYEEGSLSDGFPFGVGICRRHNNWRGEPVLRFALKVTDSSGAYQVAIDPQG